MTDVQDMARKYIKPSNCNIIVVGNKDNVADKLKKFDSDGKLDFYDAFGKKLEEAKIEMDPNLTATDVVNDYLDAIGGKEKLSGVKSMYTAMKTNVMGQDASLETYQMAPDKFAMKVNMMGMTVQEQKYDGMKGLNAQMGQKKVITEGPELEEMKAQAKMFEQQMYGDAGYKLEIKGIENVEGANCYKVIVTTPKGDVTTEFYDIKTNLLSRSVKTAGEGEKMATITNDFKDYKSVEGIMVPHSISISGAMPVPMVLEATTIEINKRVAADVFKVE